VRHGRRRFGLALHRRDHHFQLAFLPPFPLWSFTMILIDALVIWVLVVQVRVVEDVLETRRRVGQATARPPSGRTVVL
jgi:hypothetical protein